MLHYGTPAADHTVSIAGPDGLRERLETDADGIVALPELKAGRHPVRVRIDIDEPGELNNQPYVKTTRDASLIVDLE